MIILFLPFFIADIAASSGFFSSAFPLTKECVLKLLRDDVSTCEASAADGASVNKARRD